MLPVFISYTNFGYVKLAENLIRSTVRAVENYRERDTSGGRGAIELHMYCLDDETYEYLKPYQQQTSTIKLIPFYEHKTSKKYEKYGSQGFKHIDHIHFSVIRDALKTNDFIHFMDADTVFMRKPTANDFAEFAEYDMVFQCDHPYLEPLYDTWSCIGNMSLRNTERTFFVLDSIDIYKYHFPDKNDQEILQKIFKDTEVNDIRAFPHAKVSQYSPLLFTCGGILKENMYDLKDTVIFHANYTMGLNEKVTLLKKANAWFCE